MFPFSSYISTCTLSAHFLSPFIILKSLEDFQAFSSLFDVIFEKKVPCNSLRPWRILCTRSSSLSLHILFYPVLFSFFFFFFFFLMYEFGSFSFMALFHMGPNRYCAGRDLGEGWAKGTCRLGSGSVALTVLSVNLPSALPWAQFSLWLLKVSGQCGPEHIPFIHWLSKLPFGVCSSHLPSLCFTPEAPFGSESHTGQIWKKENWCTVPTMIGIAVYAEFKQVHSPNLKAEVCFLGWWWAAGDRRSIKRPQPVSLDRFIWEFCLSQQLLAAG